MKLTEAQANRVWGLMIEAEVRSLYFGELANRYTRQKQWITGSSLFMSSAAAASIAVPAIPNAIPILMSVATAILTAYSIAMGLDKMVVTLTKLHGQWHHIQTEYENLWYHWQNDDAEERFDQTRIRERDISEIGLEMPYDESLVNKWTDITYDRYTTKAA